MEIKASIVSETTRRDAGALESCKQRKFAPAPIWTEAMLAALKFGVKGGKWHSLIDKVSRLETLELGWTRVAKNAGAAGVDRMSVERFAQGRDRYLAELARALQDGSYRPQAVRRVYIPKGKGQRPLGIPVVKDRVAYFPQVADAISREFPAQFFCRNADGETPSRSSTWFCSGVSWASKTCTVVVPCISLCRSERLNSRKTCSVVGRAHWRCSG